MEVQLRRLGVPDQLASAVGAPVASCRAQEMSSSSDIWCAAVACVLAASGARTICPGRAESCREPVRRRGSAGVAIGDGAAIALPAMRAMC